MFFTPKSASHFFSLGDEHFVFGWFVVKLGVGFVTDHLFRFSAAAANALGFWDWQNDFSGGDIRILVFTAFVFGSCVDDFFYI